MQEERRRLTKRAPHSSDRTPNTLRRTPSAPLRSRSNSSAQQSIQHHRTPTLPSPGTSSHNSIDSTLAQNAAGASSNSQLPQHLEPRYSVTAKTSTDLLGQSFDSAAILQNLNAVTYPSELPFLQPQPPPHLLQQHSDLTLAQRPDLRYQNSNQSTTTLANPDVRLSQSLAATGRRMDDINAPRGELGAKSPRQRLSDEAKEGKPVKKKTGFSSFVNNLVGTPKRPAISAPENPVHVTHVGYDQETGEFTVGN
jgi:p21-activated kinase 1